MEDNYLDKIFQDKLESPQHFDFDEAAWDNLAVRLDDEPNRRIIPWQWFAAAGIVLPLLLSSVYLFLQLKATEKTVAKLETQVDNLEETIVSEKLSIADNTANESVNNAAKLTQVDNPTIVFRNDSKAIAKQAMAAINPIELTSNTFQNTITEKESTLYKENKSSKEFTSAESFLSYGENANYLNRIVYTSASISKKAVDNSRLSNWITKERELDFKESNWDKAKMIFIPVGFEVGAIYQTGVTLAQDLSLEQRPLFNAKGIKGAINFANKVDLTIGANYLNTAFESQTIGRDFPHVIPNKPTDVFQKVVVSERIVQIPVGLKYNFGNYDALFSPFVEIGAIARRVVEKNHRYEYKPETVGNEFYAITPRSEPITPKPLALNTVTGTVGITWNPDTKILNNMMLQAEVFTAADIENMDNPVTMVGVGVSAKYMF